MTPLEKRAEELAQIIREFDGDMKVEFIAKYPEIWNDCYDVMEQSRYHRVMINCFKAGFMSALKYQPEVKALLKTLEYYAGLSIESVNGHTKAHYDDSEQGPKMSFYEGETWLCGDRAKEALKAWGEFIGENK